MNNTEAKKLLEIKNLVVEKHSIDGSLKVLNVDDIVLNRGETLGIVGESGAGKTVLALTILGLLPSPPGKIVSGRIILDGVDLRQQNHSYMHKNIRGHKVAMIFQDPMSTLNPVFTVGTQLMNVIKKEGHISNKDAKLKAVELLSLVKLPDADTVFAKYPHQLSGGQRQRVIIALALACKAELIIADEPTRNLDVTIQASILLLFKELQQKIGLTVLFIANNLALVSAFCDNVIILRHGCIVERGCVKDVLINPQAEYTKLLIQSNKHNDSKKIFNNNEILLKVKGLRKYFPVEKAKQKGLFVKAVDGIDLNVKKGEIIGIVGESGCGKSTFVNTILCLHAPTAGKVYFNDEDIFSLSKNELRHVRKKIQIVFQDPYWSLDPRWLVRDIIAEPLRVHEHLTAANELYRVEELLTLVGLKPEDAFLYPHEFSGGERQRIAIARALAVNPELVVLDEPTSAIDVMSQSQILKLIESLRQSLGLTILLISHDLGVVSQLADRIMVMYLGKIVELGYTNDIFKEPLHPYTKALFNSIPRISVDGKGLQAIEGEIPSAVSPPSGCRFHPRCPYAITRCAGSEPVAVSLNGTHEVSCFLVNKLNPWQEETTNENA